jgi:hypothetical protein
MDRDKIFQIKGTDEDGERFFAALDAFPCFGIGWLRDEYARCLPHLDSRDEKVRNNTALYLSAILDEVEFKVWCRAAKAERYAE